MQALSHQVYLGVRLDRQLILNEHIRLLKEKSSWRPGTLGLQFVLFFSNVYLEEHAHIQSSVLCCLMVCLVVVMEVV